jgi:hypothetical protein
METPYGSTKFVAIELDRAVSIQAMADRLEYSEAGALLNVTFNAA